MKLNERTKFMFRSLGAYYTGETVYNNIPVDIYKADLGDQTNNKEDKCFCTTPETCMKKGLMDLTRCVGAPIMVSLPHFYLADESYLNSVRGLHPNEKEHGIQILFEPVIHVVVNLVYIIIKSQCLDDRKSLSCC